MAFPIIPIVTGGLSLISRKYAVKVAKDKIRKSTKTGIEKAREYGKMTNRNFKGYDIDPVTGNAIATFHRAGISGFEKGFITGTGLTALAMPEYKPSTTKKPMSKKDKAVLKYNKKMQETHKKYGIK